MGVPWGWYILNIKVVMYLSKLNIKQKRFADEYIKLGSIYEALKAAGYTESYARGKGCKILENKAVKSYIDEKMKDLEDKAIADQKEVLEYLTRVMRGEEKESVLVNSGDFKQEVREIDVGAKDRIKAAELIGKRYSLWTEKLEVEAETVIIKDDIDE